LKFLEKEGFKQSHGLDISRRAVEVCKNRGLDRVYQMDGTRTGFEDNFFDVIIASDVLEHIEDDSAAIREWGRILKKGGKMMIFVPAFNFLWSDHDEVLYHYRRYEKSRLNYLFKKNNLKTVRSSYWNFTLFAPISLFRLLRKSKKKNKPEDQLNYPGNFINNSLLNLFKVENALLKKINLPVGVSLFFCVTK
jgi:SAM-dependent methyltransferase